ncbi:MAG: ABC transporter ATP-binding protein, partial [Chlamydiae bacterium]|nr:ABC transporter ATP-binding protein [Chlamydiota bacterium]
MVLAKDKALPEKLFPFIWHFVREYKNIIIFYFTLNIVTGFWGPLNSLLIKHVINLLPNVTGSNSSILIKPASLIVVNLIVIYQLTRGMINYIENKFTPLIMNCVIGESLDHILQKSAQFYKKHLLGETLKDLTNLSGIFKFLIETTPFIARSASVLLTTIVASYFAHPIFSFILVVWLILLLLLRIFMYRKLMTLASSQRLSTSSISGEQIDCLLNHDNIRSFSRRPFEALRMALLFKNQANDYQSTYFYSLRMQSLQAGLFSIMVAFSCYFLIHLYSKNLVTIGDFALILGLYLEIGRVASSVCQDIDPLSIELRMSQGSLTSLMLPLEIHDKPDTVALKCNRGQITFDNVKFHYEGKETEPLFKNISIKIKASSKVGLVGYSGAGKSTFVN